MYNFCQCKQKLTIRRNLYNILVRQIVKGLDLKKNLTACAQIDKARNLFGKESQSFAKGIFLLSGVQISF